MDIVVQSSMVAGSPHASVASLVSSATAFAYSSEPHITSVATRALYARCVAIATSNDFLFV